MADKLISVDPSTGKKIAGYAIDNEKKVTAALITATEAFAKWRKQPYSKRAKVLNNIAKELRKQKERLAILATQEMGKPIQQGREEVEKCAVTLEYYANEGEGFLKDIHVKTDATKSYVTYQPLGVILAIMPWNFPYWQVFRAFAPTIMAGNVMVLKHASNVSGCAVAIEELIIKAGAPKGLLQTFLLPSSRIEKIIEHPAVAAVTLTGSTAAGRKVAEAAGRSLKKQVLELGGSDAYIILDDADIEAAAQICVDGRLKNSGQSCVAAKRFIVTKNTKKAFEEAMTRRMEAATWGDPMNDANKVGPMARHDLRDQLHEQVIKSIEMGAKLLCGGYIPKDKGAYYPTTVLTDVVKGMPAHDEELFGPVAAIIVAKNEADAMRIANDNEYGLGGAIIGKNIAKAEKMAVEEMEAGSIFINDFVHSDQRLPFGGVKHSGYGREIGEFGIKEFVNIKTIYIK
ncbi:succinate-semialdehyde dehydrogenase [Flavipsychrobacter stenotrophus]|uniref:Succinate-semialdehyde dehydrogenase n=1 Tax=Flavipsychrobacter stenotrophus TaxID=2077091 RepID=A0A2S7T018_9BACT|nr:NAD-dependent succinate-semialdehyde dehydrogenase [Flavipsychrobacter stenotrophus]PQJ12540.1 succinate-semialdehyde dehydrogenase [Flavipsychrobacter stenotrophus]